MQSTWQRRKIWNAGLCGFCFVVLISLLIARLTHAQLLGHSPFDSYTLQALAWRSGHLALPENVPYLELAIYQGCYYVSFPPVPTLPMWLLSFFFGAQTPNALVTYLYFLLSFVVAYALALRSMRPYMAAGLATFLLLGGSLLDIAVSADSYAGAVWYQAQLLSLLLTLLAFYCLTGRSNAGGYIGLICIALAVGCRPFQAVYVPFLLFLLYQRLHTEHQTPTKALWHMIPYLLLPACIALAYGIFHFVRFGNPLEFGHRYLPEFSTEGGTQFALAHILPNLRNLLRPPQWQNGALSFPTLHGFAFYLTNPLLWLAPLALLVHRKRPSARQWVLLASILLHLFLLLLHRTFGGWQYGSRYLCDLLPALLLLRTDAHPSLRKDECVCMGLLMLFNLYGGLIFHQLG